MCNLCLGGRCEECGECCCSQDLGWCPCSAPLDATFDGLPLEPLDDEDLDFVFYQPRGRTDN